MTLELKWNVDHLASKAIHHCADAIEVEYKDGYEEVVAMKGNIGFEIARFRSNSRKAFLLRDELHSIVRRKRRLNLDDEKYELRGRIYESFGEEAFRIDLRRV